MYSKKYKLDFCFTNSDVDSTECWLTEITFLQRFSHTGPISKHLFSGDEKSNQFHSYDKFLILYTEQKFSLSSSFCKQLFICTH